MIPSRFTLRGPGGRSCRHRAPVKGRGRRPGVTSVGGWVGKNKPHGQAAKFMASHTPCSVKAERAVCGSEPPNRGAQPQAVGAHLRVVGCAAEALSAADAARRSRGSGLLFASGRCPAPQKQGTATRGDSMKNKEKGVAAQFVPAGTPPPLFDQIKNPRSQEQGCGYSGRRPKRGIRVTGLHRRQDVTLVGAVARYCVKPLALSRFLRRGTAPACKNRSAAPAAAPCFIHWMRSPPLPLLTFLPEK